MFVNHSSEGVLVSLRSRGRARQLFGKQNIFQISHQIEADNNSEAKESSDEEINEASESNDEIKNGNNAGNAPRPGPRVTPARDDKCVHRHPASQPQQPPQPPPSVTAFVKF